MTDRNPYAAPGAEIAVPLDPRTVRLFGPRALAAHSVLMAPVVGAVLAAVNHHRRGDAPAVRRTLLAYVLPSAILLVALLAAGERLSAALQIASFVWGVTLARVLYREHRDVFEKHVEAGGRVARWYLVTLCCVVALTFYAAVATILALGARS